MSANEVVVAGFVRRDGTLALDGPVELPAGRVSVRVETVPYSRESDPLFVLLRQIRAERERAGPKRTGQEAQAALARLRDDVSEEVDEIGRIREQCVRRRDQADEAAKGAG